MYVIYTVDNGVTEYLKSAFLGYSWVTDINKAKKFKTEKEARTVIRDLYLKDKGLYKVRYI